jgi:hypothetical protein
LFCYKGREKKDVSFSLSYGGNFVDLQFVNCLPKKFADLRFAVQSKEICQYEIFGLTYLRNLLIFDCELSLRICGFEICGFKKTFAHPSMQICHRCQQHRWHIVPVSTTAPAVNLPPVSTALVMHP